MAEKAKKEPAEKAPAKAASASAHAALVKRVSELERVVSKIRGAVGVAIDEV